MKVKKLLRKLLGLFGPRPVFWSYNPNARCPVRGSEESAGLDLYAVNGLHIAAGETVIVPTALQCDFLPGWVALIWDRSGMGAKGIHRFAGVIDSDYRGLWGVVLHNSTSEEIVVNIGDRVAQVVFQRCWIGKPRWSKTPRCLQDTNRGAGGFGSTGR